MSWQQYYDWLQTGIDNGWISPTFCSTHDEGPLTDEEYNEIEQGYDPCFVVVRVYGQEKILPPNRHPIM